MRRTRYERAFTLVELMVGLMVTSVILSAVATLAFAMSSASTVGNDSARTAARIRHTTLYLSDLIGNCKMICAAPGKDLVLWRADDNKNGRINLNELVYIERGSDSTLLQLRRFWANSDPEYTLAQLSQSGTKDQMGQQYNSKITSLISDCNNVQFGFLGASPPRTRTLAITLEVFENGRWNRCETVAAVRCRADYLLDASNQIVTGDDD